LRSRSAQRIAASCEGDWSGRRRALEVCSRPACSFEPRKPGETLPRWFQA